MAEGLSISVAAQRLGYAQSSVSTQLRALEDELGVALFTRTSTGVELAAAGETLLPYARQSLELDAEMQRVVTSGRPRLRIGALPSLVDHWLPELLVALTNNDRTRARQLPDSPAASTEITVMSGPRTQLSEKLADGRLDLIFLFDNGVATTGPHLLVARDQVIVVAGSRHPLAGRDGVSMSELLDWEFLIAEAGCTSQMLVDRLGRDVGRMTPTAMVTGSLTALRHIAGNGHGLALLPRLSVEQELQAGELVEISVHEPLSSIGIEARWREPLGAAEGVVGELLRFARRAEPGLAQTA